jgi:nucleoside-diphosphate-sugar epimerase
MEYSTPLVTGASGFIGSALSAFLISQGLHVIATSRRHNPDEIARQTNCKYSHLDVMSVGTDSQKLGLADSVVHCATSNDIDSRSEHGGFSLSVEGTHRLLANCRHVGVRKVILEYLQLIG